MLTIVKLSYADIKDYWKVYIVTWCIYANRNKLLSIQWAKTHSWRDVQWLCTHNNNGPSQKYKLFFFSFNHYVTFKLESTAICTTHTCVLVLGFVHLAIGAFSNDANDVKFVHAALAPVTLGLHSLTIPRTAEPAQTRQYNQYLGINRLSDWHDFCSRLYPCKMRSSIQTENMKQTVLNRFDSLLDFSTQKQNAGTKWTMKIEESEQQTLPNTTV